MPKLSHIVFIVILGLAICGFTINAASEGQEQPAATLRPIPGITAPDQFPRGCVDCHINHPEMNMDARISTLMRHWKDGVDPALLAKVRAFSPADLALKGKHPDVEGALADIPNACLKCHSRKSTSVPPFSRLLHGLHLVGGEKNFFLTMFQGECTYCHKLDLATGSWSLGSGAEK